MGVSPLPIFCSRLPRSSTGRHSPLPDQSLARCLCVSVAISNPVRPLFSSLMSLFHRSLTAPASPLESTLAKVYQNKQLQLPLESTLVKNIGRGRVIVNQPRISTLFRLSAGACPDPVGVANQILLATRHSPLSSRALLGREGLEGGVDQVRIVELGFVAGIFAANGQEARGERLVPLDREGGHVSGGELQLLVGDVAGGRAGVEAGAGKGAGTQQRVEGG